jgi:hypothetical protein
MRIDAVLLVLLAPLPYWALGLPWLLRGDLRRIPLAPLVGCALAGFYAELALIFGLPVRATVGILVLASAAVAGRSVRRTHPAVARAFAEWLPIYLFSVLAASISPFPVLGNWEGDWFLLYEMGRSVLDGVLGPGMLARPPLFGAAATPLWVFSDGLAAYQLMAAVASASAVTAMLAFIDHHWPKTPRFVLVPFLLSPFFLHHTAAAWAKLLAGGLILSAIVEGLRNQRLASAALFALSVAVHEGSIIWAPCILLAHADGGRGWRGALRALGPMAMFGLVIVGPLEAWILVHYGLAAKIASNPVITDSGAMPTPFWLKTAMAVLTTFVGWGPISSVARWLRRPSPASMAVVSKEAFWLITSWVTTLAGTLLGLLFPFLVAGRRWFDSSTLRRLLVGRAALGALGFAVLANALLTGFYSNEGTMQAALIPLALLLYGIMVGPVGAARSAGRARVRTMSTLMAIAGSLPWIALNLTASTGLWLSAGFRARMQVASEGDYFRVLDNHLAPLGMAAFPQVPLLCVVLLAGLALLQRRWRRPAPLETESVLK